MMLNLFFIFDFYSHCMTNWISSFLGLFFLPHIFWIKKFRLYMMYYKLYMALNSEFYVVMKSKFNNNNMIFFVTLFMFIMYNNFLGLFPYIFTSSSHLVFSMTFSLTMWMGVMFFGLFNNLKMMLIHLVPQGTPFILMFFMVLIELLSILIRPMTLCIRLVANMIAGHLLLTLLSNFISSSLLVFMFMFILQLILLLLEMSVSFIQSYVFVILMVLYLKEMN